MAFYTSCETLIAEGQPLIERLAQRLAAIDARLAAIEGQLARMIAAGVWIKLSMAALTLALALALLMTS